MEITKVDIKYINPKKTLKAICDVVFDDVFVVHGVKIVERKNKIFVSMPAENLSNRKFLDICHPINQKMRDYLTCEVLSRYEIFKNKI